MGEAAGFRLARGLGWALALAALGAGWHALALPAIDGDGPHLVSTMSRADGELVVWYHAAYLCMGWAVEHVIGIGRSIEALLWTSALSAAGALVVLAWTLQRERGARLLYLPLLLLAASPGFAFNATRIEVHATQGLGAALALAAGLVARSRGAPLRFALAAAGQCVASVCHNSNLAMAPGLAFIAMGGARRPGERVAAIAGTALGALAGLWTNASSPAGGSDLGLEHLGWLVTSWMAGPSLEYIASDLLSNWWPLLSLVPLVDLRRLGAAAPILAATLPSGAFFLMFGVESDGGYYTTAAVGCALAGGLAIDGERRSAHLIAVAAALVGGVFAWDAVRDPARALSAAHGEVRYQLARSVLTEGGVFISADPGLQVVDGRERGLHELDVCHFFVAAIVENADEERFARAIEAQLARAAAGGHELAIDQVWLMMARYDPRLEPLMTTVEELAAKYFDLSEYQLNGRTFLRGRPRAAAQG